jgi:hypothetical protein
MAAHSVEEAGVIAISAKKKKLSEFVSVTVKRTK